MPFRKGGRGGKHPRAKKVAVSLVKGAIVASTAGSAVTGTARTATWLGLYGALRGPRIQPAVSQPMDAETHEDSWTGIEAEDIHFLPHEEIEAPTFARVVEDASCTPNLAGIGDLGRIQRRFWGLDMHEMSARLPHYHRSSASSVYQAMIPSHSMTPSYALVRQTVGYPYIGYVQTSALGAVAMFRNSIQTR